MVEPEIRRNQSGEVTIKGFDSGVDIFYTTDGTVPDSQTTKYTQPFILNKKSVVNAMVIDPISGKQSTVKSVHFDVSKENWKIKGDFGKDEKIQAVFDGNPETSWNLKSKPPVDIVIDLSDNLNIAGFTYLPDQGRWGHGVIGTYELYVSNDAKNWGKPVSAGEFANIKNSPVLQKKEFDTVEGRYLKFRALSPAEENGNIGIAEFDIITNK